MTQNGVHSKAVDHGGQDAEPPRVVVGVDGSEGSLEALDWAVREAQELGATLHLVAAWMTPAPTGYFIMDTHGDFLLETRAMLDRAVARAKELAPGLEIRAELMECLPALALVQASRGARLLVVGSRGRGGFRGLLLGSVSQHCTRHAECPVLVVRPHRERCEQDAAGHRHRWSVGSHADR